MTVDLNELIRPKLTIVNKNVDLNDRLQERAARPIINSNPLVKVDGALDEHSEAALASNRANRKAALEQLRKR